jgi:hypothetical protein
MIDAVYAVERFAERHGPLTHYEAEMLVWYLVALRKRKPEPKWIRSDKA